MEKVITPMTVTNQSETKDYLFYVFEHKNFSFHKGYDAKFSYKVCWVKGTFVPRSVQKFVTCFKEDGTPFAKAHPLVLRRRTKQFDNLVYSFHKAKSPQKRRGV